jgi:hypothetical protein
VLGPSPHARLRAEDAPLTDRVQGSNGTGSVPEGWPWCQRSEGDRGRIGTRGSGASAWTLGLGRQSAPASGTGRSS